MGWISEQAMYKKAREDFEESLLGPIALIEQREFLFSDDNILKEIARRIGNIERKRQLEEDVITPMLFCEYPMISGVFVFIVLILRDDGFIYFGLRQTIATLGLGGRYKNGNIELYDEYKDQIDDYVTKRKTSAV